MPTDAEVRAQRRAHERKVAGVARGQEEHARGYRKLDGGWENSTTHRPDTVDRKGREDLGGLTKSYAPRPERKHRRSFGVDYGD